MKITCHKNEPHYVGMGEDTWREPDHNKREDNYAGQPFRTCSYCGSMHPEDFLNYLKNNPKELHISGSDWKYGWPHKFYIDVPNPTPEKNYKVGSSYANGVEKEMVGKVEKCHGKFYNVHLLDCVNEPYFQELCDLITLHFHIKFAHDEKGLFYSAPRYNYQTWTSKEHDGYGH